MGAASGRMDQHMRAVCENTQPSGPLLLLVRGWRLCGQPWSVNTSAFIWGENCPVREADPNQAGLPRCPSDKLLWLRILGAAQLLKNVLLCVLHPDDQSEGSETVLEAGVTVSTWRP